jgi:uncharacterized protein (DUF924 family)
MSEMATASDVLRFWFEVHGEADWFGGKPEFDAALAAQFTATHAAVTRGEAWSWRRNPEGRLAEIIVLDQFSRQLYRGRGASFASDTLALALAQEMVGGGHHNFLPLPQRLFVLMPFMHSESALMQAESVRLFTATGSDWLGYALAHAEIIGRFGRFPGRNAALGRASTEEELRYIASSKGMF